MKLRSFRTFLALLMPLLFVLYFTFWNFWEQKPPAFRFTVSVPTADNPDFTDEELRKYAESGNMLPVGEFKKRGLPAANYDGFLIVSIERDGKLKINQQVYGSIENTAPLSKELGEIFAQRENAGMFEENTGKIVKSVVVKAPLTEKYGNVVKIIDAVKQSGADPVVLQIDCLPE